ncbi:MAG: succinylglutamate desuccinylase/aspartoacylase family protein [Flavobacteriales bacterium]|jgi:predicted deacylase|nr:succinylglutamate desuccinylase/aspartoacylase family protein [Flavobacteriales bacterium]
MEINGEKIKKGTYKCVQIPISTLPSGTSLTIDVHVFLAKENGPTVLFAGGLHGDEINGVEIVRQAIEKKSFSNLKKGAVIAIPLINTLGFINYARETSGKDVNRSFPGSKSGSLASLIAYEITNEILPWVDFGVDFHTGGASLYNYPQLRVTKEDEEALALAKASGVPLIIKKNAIAKSHRKQALLNDKPLVVYEGGESLRLDNFSIAEGLKIINNILMHYGVIEGKLIKDESEVFEESKWMRSPSSGVFLLLKKAGDYVEKGEVLGEVNQINSSKKEIIRSKYKGKLIGHRNNPVVVKGDALFHVAIK